MGDDSSGSLEGKSLSNMRVVDLKLHLEKRGLSKSGSKKELVKRLKQKLELEKLYEESAADGDSEPKLHLDEATEQNEFVKQYLAEQQKLYAKQKEVKRLIELQEQQRLDEEDETDSDLCNKDQDSDVSESVSIAKNSCDSSTHAEGGDEEETKSSEDRDYVSHTAKENEPESSTKGDLVTYSSKVDHIEPSESSHSQSSMDSANPDSAVSYSLSDIHLPDSPKKLISKILKAKNGKNNALEEPLEQENAAVGLKKTNGTSDADETSNHSRKSASPEHDSASPEPVAHPSGEDDTSAEKEEEAVEPMDTGVDNRSVEAPPTEETEVDSSVGNQDMETEKVEKGPSDVEPAENQDSQEADSSHMDVVENESRPKRADIEEGETDVDSESDEDSSKKKKDEQEETNNERTGNISRRESCESRKSHKSSSRESSSKSADESSSSDSSSSHDSVPKRKSYSRSKSHTEGHIVVSSSSGHRSDDHTDKKRSSDEKESSKCEVSSEKPRRVKIKRSTPIISPSEPEPKKEISRLHHKKIEIETIEKRNPSSSSTVVDSKSKKESISRKRSAEEVVPASDVPPPKVTYRKLNIPFRRNEDNKRKNVEKRRVWNSIPALKKTGLSISTDSLKSLIPDFKVICSPSILSESDEKVLRSNFEQITSTKPHAVSRSSEPPKKAEKPQKVVEPIPKKQEGVKETPVESMEVEEHHQRIVLPERPATNMLFIRNLVRPFTLLQLKEVLKQTGSLIEDGFWIDKIKSKCLVTYETVEQSVKTRESLHNTRWPASNPKILTVEFVTKEEFELHKSEGEELKPPPVVAPAHSPERPVANVAPPEPVKKKEKEEKPKERERQRKAIVYVREWDKDKLSQESPERDHHHPAKSSDRRKSTEDRERRGRTESTRESSREEKEVRKRQEEETPAKLLDDLFHKTKATPCIYWLPLTEEQVKQKEEERRLRRLEREKRNQEQEEAEKARRKPREKTSRSRTRSPPPRRR